MYSYRTEHASRYGSSFARQYLRKALFSSHRARRVRRVDARPRDHISFWPTKLIIWRDNARRRDATL